MKLYLGIDGGQTATKCVVADEEGHILGFSVGGPCRHLRDEQSRGQVKQALEEVVQSALRNAGGPGAVRIISAFLGISGVAGPQSSAGMWLQEFFSQRFNPEIVAIDHDARSALAGAIPSMVGVTVIAGTGSIAFGRNTTGKEVRAGGWGYLIGDSGSAFEIGRQALAAVLRAEEGFGPATSLREAVLRRMGIEETALIPETIHQSNEAKLRVAEIGSVVSEQAQIGDKVAARIIETAGRGLAELAGAVIRRLFRQSYPVAVSGVGGVLHSGELIWKVFADEVVSRWPASKVGRAVFPPWIGAVILAYHNAGLPVSAASIECLRQSIPYESLSS